MASYASTFADLQASVADKLRLDTTADATRIKAWLNQYLVDIAVKTRYFSGSSAGSALAAAATAQTLPSAIVELEYVTCAFGGQTTYLTPVGFDQILMFRSAGTAASGPPQWYSLRKDSVEFFPAAQGGEILTYYGATLPTAMSGGTDLTGLPEPWATLTVTYGACIEASDFKSDAKLYLYYQQAYASSLAQFQAYLNTRMTRSSREMPVYGPDGRPFGIPFLPHDPSSDFFVTGWRG